MTQTVIANLVQLYDAARKLEISAQSILTASNTVHTHIQNLGPERYESRAAKAFRIQYNSSRDNLNAVGPQMLSMANDLRMAIERIAEAAGVSSANHDLQFWSQQQHMQALQAQYADMDRSELLSILEQDHLQFCSELYDKLSDHEIRRSLLYFEIMERNGVSRGERSGIFLDFLAGETDLNTIRQNTISSFQFTVDLPENVPYSMVEASRVEMELARDNAAQLREQYELAGDAQAAQLRQDYIDWRTGNNDSQLDSMRQQAYFESVFGGSVGDLEENSFWSDVEFEKSQQVHDATVGGFRNTVADWAESNNYNDGVGYGVDAAGNWNAGRHCTTYVTTAMRENGYPIDVIHGNSQLHQWMENNPSRWEYTNDIDSLEAGDFVFMNWPGRGTIDQSLANGAGISHVVLVTGSGEYAQWNSELINQPITQIPERAGDHVGVRMIY